MRVSERALGVPQSETAAISSRARQLAGEGFDVVDFSIGEPDQSVPENVKAKTIEAVQRDITKYPPAAGRQDLKEAIARKLKRDNALDYSAEEIVVSSGAKQSLYSAMLATIDPGDEVIVPRPYWVSYPEQVRLCGGVPVFADTDSNFLPSVAELQERITKRTKLLIINSPNNPTGAVYPERLLGDIAKLAVENGITVISDEIYEKIIYEGRHRSIASFGDGIKEQTITINGLSKSHAMTGYRIGYAAATTDIAGAMTRIQSHSSGPSSIAQYAAVEALDGSGESVEAARREFMRRRDTVVKGLSGMEGVSLVRPSGAFYVFPDVAQAYERRFGRAGKSGAGKSVGELFAERLLDEQKVAAVPGRAFGSDSCIRLSYAVSDDRIAEGLERIRRFVS